MQALALLLPVQVRPVDRWAVGRLSIDTPIGDQALLAWILAGGQTMAERQDALPAVETNRIAGQQGPPATSAASGGAGARTGRIDAGGRSIMTATGEGNHWR